MERIPRYILCQAGVDAHITRLEGLATRLSITTPGSQLEADLREEVRRIKGEIEKAPLK